MREFKFRIFDLEDNKMYQNRDFEGIDFVDKYARLENGFIDLDNAVVMQYTGYADSKGQDIYEGDILAYMDYWWIRIEYENGGFMVRDVDKVRYNNKITNTHISDFDLSKWRIIGNVYENKELFLNI